VEVAEGQGADKQRAIRRQNEAAAVLAYAGYRVENSPTITANDGLSAGKEPDFRIEGLIFDGYAPFSEMISAANPLLAYLAIDEKERQEVGAKMKEVLSLYGEARMEQREREEFDEYEDDISNALVWQSYCKAKLAYALAAITTHIRQKGSSGQTHNVVANLADSICTAQNLIGQLTESPVSGLATLICIKPKGDAEVISSHPTKTGGYRIHRAADFDIEEHTFSSAAPLSSAVSLSSGSPLEEKQLKPKSTKH
ncbi:MAG: hypothetical protein ACREP9_10730, partial [Candidatus Dormibacteraceae bacterium]